MYYYGIENLTEITRSTLVAEPDQNKRGEQDGLISRDKVVEGSRA